MSALEILNKFKPIIIFDSEEKFFPCDLNYYLSHTVDQAEHPGCLVGYNHPADLMDAPLYGTMKKLNNGNFLLQYVAFFPAAGPFYMCGCVPYQWPCKSLSEAIFKFIHVVIDPQQKFIISVMTESSLIQNQDPFFSEYFFHDRVKIFSSLYTHNLNFQTGHQPVPDNMQSFLTDLLITDRNDESGLIWEVTHIEYIDEMTPWNRFNGQLGSSNTTPLYHSSWLKPQWIC